MTFDEVFASMLKELDNGKSVEEIVKKKSEALGLSKESQEQVEKAIGFVDKINEVRKELQAAKEKGASREEWLDAKLEELKEGLDEKQRATADEVMEKISKSAIDNMIKD